MSRLCATLPLLLAWCCLAGRRSLNARAINAAPTSRASTHGMGLALGIILRTRVAPSHRAVDARKPPVWLRRRGPT